MSLLFLLLVLICCEIGVSLPFSALTAGFSSHGRDQENIDGTLIVSDQFTARNTPLWSRLWKENSESSSASKTTASSSSNGSGSSSSSSRGSDCILASNIVTKDVSKRLFLKGGFGRVNGKKKVLILMSDTGGGHRASAEAIDLALKEAYPGKIDVEIVDIWTAFAPYPFNTFVPSYRFLARHPLLWRAFYFYGRFPPTKIVTELWSRSTCYEIFRRAIEHSSPDMVVSVHPLCQFIPIPIVKKMNLARDPAKKPISFVTVVTDLGSAHVTWFHKGVDAIFVPGQAVRNIALRMGLAAKRVVMHGLPIRSQFWSRGPSKAVARRALELENCKTVLVMGGGDGIGGLSKITTTVVRRLSLLEEKTQVIVICGWNKSARMQLSSTEWPSNVNVVVKGFTKNIDEYMGAADCLVTKAGPGTIAEAMTRGLPIIISSYLPGQEEGNVPYCVKGGFGIYAGRRPRVIAKMVHRLFKDPELLQRMSEAAEQRANPDATRFIAKDIGALVLSEEEQILSFKDTMRRAVTLMRA